MDILPKNIFFKEPYIETPYKKKVRILFADATATGRSSPIVEKYIYEEILPFYSNSHSNSFCASLMSKKMKEVRDYIRRLYNLDDNYKILFSGNGATGAINHLVHTIDYSRFDKVNIIITIVEHYSNHLPWMKIVRKHKNMKVWYIPLKRGEIDLELLEYFLEGNSVGNVLNIISITGCSNVTGIKTDLDRVKRMRGMKTYLFVDMACMAPHEIIDGRDLDAFFISGHKFIGGNGTTGILIARDKLFNKRHPYIPGGGTVDFACCNKIEYLKDVEEKESGGTPNIIGIIKLKKAMELTYSFKDMIRKNELWIVNYVNTFFTKLLNTYDNFDFLFPSIALNHRIPIFCIIIKDINHNDVVLLLNDLFGIQTRGGLSCCGMLADYLRNKMKKNYDGWCRITFSWYMTEEEVDYILNSVKFLVENSKKIKVKNGIRKAV